MNNLEDKIRDKIASDLTIIGENFELIDTEFYIPEAKTTKSFIDILAKNKDNDYIIIEVKRSNQSSRQAIHEIYKYTEAIKDRYKVTKGEIQAYIVSTEWKELYIPFSAFVNESKISLKGIEIEIDKNVKILSAKTITPCKTDEGRLFSRIQDCNLYLNEENLEKGIQSHIEILAKKELEDYVLVILKGANINEEKLKANMRSMFANMIGKDESEVEEDFDKIPIYNHMIYLGFQRQDKEKYFEILKRDPVQFKETMEYLEFAELDDEDDILSTLESNILGDLKPWFYCDSSEIGYPAKFGTKILDNEKWEIQRIVRSKSLEENKLLTDKKIISEMRGDTGISNVILKQACSIEHKAKYNEIKKYAEGSFKYNSVWLNHIKIFFSETDKLKDYNLEINVFNPYNIVLTLMHIVAKNDFEGYAPNYQLAVNKNNHTKVYFGTFHWNGKKPDFNKIIKKYYNDDPGNILMTLVFGGHEWNNDDILEDLGLTYESYMYEESNDGFKLFLYKNFKFVKVDEIENGLIDFIENNLDFITLLEHIYETHHHEAKIEFE